MIFCCIQIMKKDKASISISGNGSTSFVAMIINRVHQSENNFKPTLFHIRVGFILEETQRNQQETKIAQN